MGIFRYRLVRSFVYDDGYIAVSTWAKQNISETGLTFKIANILLACSALTQSDAATIQGQMVHGLYAEPRWPSGNTLALNANNPGSTPGLGDRWEINFSMQSVDGGQNKGLSIRVESHFQDRYITGNININIYAK